MSDCDPKAKTCVHGVLDVGTNSDLKVSSYPHRGQTIIFLPFIRLHSITPSHFSHPDSVFSRSCIESPFPFAIPTNLPSILDKRGASTFGANGAHGFGLLGAWLIAISNPSLVITTISVAF